MKLTLTATLLLLFFIGLTACQTPGVIISESNLPVSDHRKAIVVVINEPRLISTNGRELTSHYHDRNFNYLDVNSKTRKRYYTKAVVLGARRPYEVSVQVRVEERNPENNVFQDIGLDEGLSIARAKAIKEMLNQSRDKSSTIDGSNPF